MEPYEQTELVRRLQRLTVLTAIVCVLLVVTMGVVTALVITAVSTARTARAAVEQTNREGKQRRDQSCQITETTQLKKVQALRNTYRYLTALTPAEKGSTLNRFILQELPQQESEAKTDAAPAFCDAKGIGLPEPDPVIPSRPSGL